MTKVQEWTFTIIHGLGTLAIIILLATLLGCIPDKHLDDTVDYGIEVSSQKIVTEILNAAPLPNELKKNDTVWMGHFGRTFTSPFVILGQQTIEIPNKEDFTEGSGEDQISFSVYDVRHFEYDADGNLIQKREGQCRLILDPVVGWYPKCPIDLPPFQDQFYTLTPAFTTMGAQTILNMAMRTFSLDGPSPSPTPEPTPTPTPEPPTSTVKFYNLSTSQKTVSLPSYMVDKNKCYNFKDCKVNATSVKFDIVVKKENEKPERQRYSVLFSKELPYLASTLETCVSYASKSNNQYVPVDECFRILDFDMGQ